MVEYVPNNCFIKRLRAAVSVVVGPCGPAVLSCIGVDVHTNDTALAVSLLCVVCRSEGWCGQQQLAA